MTFKDIPGYWAAIGAVVAGTVFVLTYHDQFVTDAEAAELEQKQSAQIVLLRVDGKQAEIRSLSRDKAKAAKAGEVEEVERLQEDIQTLREEIKRLCDQIKEC